MNRRSLRDLLDVEGVDRHSYRLDGPSFEDALSLGPAAGGWPVWFTERGQASNAHEFETEDKACHYLADRLLSDAANRWVVVAGPADAAAADQQPRAWLESVRISPQDLTRSEIRTEDLPGRPPRPGSVTGFFEPPADGSLPVTILSDHLGKQLDRIPEFRIGVHRVNVRLNRRARHPPRPTGPSTCHPFR